MMVFLNMFDDDVVHMCVCDAFCLTLIWVECIYGFDIMNVDVLQMCLMNECQLLVMGEWKEMKSVLKGGIY